MRRWGWPDRLRTLLPAEAMVVASYVLSGALLGFINILFGPLILHKVGLSEYGALGLAMFVQSLFFTLAEFGVQAHLVSVLANRPESIKREIASALVFKGVAYTLSLLAFASYCLFYPHPREVKSLVAVYMAVTLFSSTHAEWHFIGSRLYGDLAKSRILTALISILLMTCWYFSSLGLWFIPAAAAFSQAIAILYLVSRTGFGGKLSYLKEASWRRVRDLLRELAPMAATQTLSPFFLASGIFLLDRLHFSKEWIGAYNIPQRVILGWISLVGPMVLFFIPKMSGGRNQNPFAKHVLYSMAATGALFPLGVGIIAAFYRISGADSFYQGFSLKAYAILSVGLFFNMVRLRHVGRMVFAQRYGRYFLIHLVSCSPILALGFLPGASLPPLGIAAAACVPELIATLLFVLPERLGTASGAA